jgi:hypothetical protein
MDTVKRLDLSPTELVCLRLRRRYTQELPSVEQLMQEQGIAGPQGRALWESYPQGTREEEEAFYRAIVDECW